ncbi:MAG: cation:dicarboxylase symporter family transporter, partial [candidate division KSB1 bacterium]|nr:cation:dicarboxylase symporter family transporter [candidate division KSB1 bacterium]
MKIYTKISIGLIAGVIFGLVLGPKAAIVEPIGKAFIRLITMVVVPLVFASLAVGTASLGSINRLGRIGFKTISFYLLTTAIAVTIGLLLANIIQPGAGLNETVKTSLLQNYQETSREQLNKAMANKPRLVDLLLQIIPTNPLRAMADGDMLGLIFFSLALGIALTYL